MPHSLLRRNVTPSSALRTEPCILCASSKFYLAFRPALLSGLGPARAAPVADGASLGLHPAFLFGLGPARAVPVAGGAVWLIPGSRINEAVAFT